ncbi:Uncharacterised protein [Mycobacteroides abscessus subsp. abscessus]|nr:Uncharacterised protein [Mycobacteroides abscessus subsp. abscessus]
MMTLPMTIFVFTLLRFIDRFPDRQANLTILDRKHFHRHRFANMQHIMNIFDISIRDLADMYQSGLAIA